MDLRVRKYFPVSSLNCPFFYFTALCIIITIYMTLGTSSLVLLVFLRCFKIVTMIPPPPPQSLFHQILHAHLFESSLLSQSCGNRGFSWKRSGTQKYSCVSLLRDIHTAIRVTVLPRMCRHTYTGLNLLQSDTKSSVAWEAIGFIMGYAGLSRVIQVTTLCCKAWPRDHGVVDA